MCYLWITEQFGQACRQELLWLWVNLLQQLKIKATQVPISYPQYLHSKRPDHQPDGKMFPSPHHLGTETPPQKVWKVRKGSKVYERKKKKIAYGTVVILVTSNSQMTAVFRDFLKNKSIVPIITMIILLDFSLVYQSVRSRGLVCCFIHKCSVSLLTLCWESSWVASALWSFDCKAEVRTKNIWK